MGIIIIIIITQAVDLLKIALHVSTNVHKHLLLPPQIAKCHAAAAGAEFLIFIPERVFEKANVMSLQLASFGQRRRWRRQGAR
jgi:hypothetical protein